METWHTGYSEIARNLDVPARTQAPSSKVNTLTITVSVLISITSVAFGIVNAYRVNKMDRLITSERLYTFLRFSDANKKIDARSGDLESVGKVLQFLIDSQKQTSANKEVKGDISKENETKILTVKQNKVSLRTAPRSDANVLMAIGKGTTIEIKEELESWYQVTAPTGETAWILKDAADEVSSG